MSYDSVRENWTYLYFGADRRFDAHSEHGDHLSADCICRSTVSNLAWTSGGRVIRKKGLHFHHTLWSAWRCSVGHNHWQSVGLDLGSQAAQCMQRQLRHLRQSVLVELTDSADSLVVVEIL